ncbi:aspartyl-phosphate phosphatase Spo0E family protein [Anaerobacillus sp. MEB173]|uniref:aspartyl-phosphate phosphatase Spo0E family protein n=1 Tax=Anaerobacillus sp. MEB173 TaxID=3383345 RepID=UPI003F921C00
MITVNREEIESKRLEMMEVAKVHGFTSEKTIKCSQELDILLNHYNNLILIETRKYGNS